MIGSLEKIPGFDHWLSPPRESEYCDWCDCHFEKPDIDCEESLACLCHVEDKEEKEMRARRIANIDQSHEIREAQ